MLASKLPVFSIQKEEVVQIFNQQLENCGVEYFDYFLLHNMNIHHYNSVVKSCKMFEHMQEWKLNISLFLSMIVPMFLI